MKSIIEYIYENEYQQQIDIIKDFIENTTIKQNKPCKIVVNGTKDDIRLITFYNEPKLEIDDHIKHSVTFTGNISFEHGKTKKVDETPKGKTITLDLFCDTNPGKKNIVFKLHNDDNDRVWSIDWNRMKEAPGIKI